MYISDVYHQSAALLRESRWIITGNKYLLIIQGNVSFNTSCRSAEEEVYNAWKLKRNKIIFNKLIMENQAVGGRFFFYLKFKIQ